MQNADMFKSSNNFASNLGAERRGGGLQVLGWKGPKVQYVDRDPLGPLHKEFDKWLSVPVKKGCPSQKRSLRPQPLPVLVQAVNLEVST